jgi:hypothetical protein
MVITDSANASSTGKIFTISVLSHFLHWHLFSTCSVAEETLVSQTVGSSSLQHDSIPVSPRIQSSSPQLEVSTSPRIHPSSPQPEVSTSPRTHPASPQPDIQESSLEPEKLPSPIWEARNDVRMNTHPFYFHLIDYY